jgi:Rab family protein
MDDDGIAQVKMVLLGDVAVGKTSLSHRFVTGNFLSNSESTVRIAFQSKNLSFKDAETGEEVQMNLRIWDTAGQEKYRSLAPL